MKRFLTIAALSVLALATTAPLALAQGRGPGGFGAGFGDAGGLALLTNEAVIKELELVEDQQEKLRALGEKQREAFREIFQGIDRDASPEERREAFEGMREKMQEQMKKVQDEVNEILLPNQVERLKQIQFQLQSRGFGGRSGLTGGRVAEELGLTEEQQEQLRAKAEEIRGETEKKIAEIRKDAEKELLQVLTPEQREKYEKLMGEPFQLPAGGFGFGGQGGFRRGEGGQGRPNRGERRGGEGDDRPDA